MNDHAIRTVLSNYSMNYHNCEVRSLGHVSGFSEAEHWKIDLPGASFCLRRWPKTVCRAEEINRLEYIQAVLWYAVYEGFHVVPLPCETFEHKGYVFYDDSLWELLPWLKGTPCFYELSDDSSDFGSVSGGTSRVSRTVSAMLTLAQFHEITSTFPLPNEPLDKSPFVQKRLDQWKKWIDGDMANLMNHIRTRQRKSDNLWELELAHESFILLDHFLTFGMQGITMLTRSSHLNVPIQPVIGNADRRHLLFEQDCVCGMLDFKKLSVDNVALDVASLLGSLAGNNPKLWKYGLKAYHSIRPLQQEELYLITVFDFAQMILTGLDLLEFYFLKRQSFLRPEQTRLLVSQIRWLTRRLDGYRFEKMNFAA